MQFGVMLFVGHLQVGDVVRPVRGHNERVIGTPAITITLTDGVKKKIDDTGGWRFTPIGGPEDFRSAYDTMTVVAVTDEYVDFIRPYLHVNKDGTPSAMGFEFVSHFSRVHNGYWYELLSVRR